MAVTLQPPKGKSKKTKVSQSMLPSTASWSQRLDKATLRVDSAKYSAMLAAGLLS
ncbi:hypothetical protein PPTG_24002 [Phytophthora nicotianae INRA-310]|uniref:Uncharacterized protein n=1 Tax=Phytophthora nicotianae (strain INRA-310) TaxID=761204 RepID=W2PNI2_PHYN3|nr:hypothetical protein PPTG_24002 [Phytophthora nicotianae INRA-310]ETN01789.1 hypothetical protein PPTG_24002 [Phytophthora nicotianae INRA-310]